MEPCSTSDTDVLLALCSSAVAAGLYGCPSTLNKSNSSWPAGSTHCDRPHGCRFFQQFERAQIANAFRERQLALRRDTEKLLSLAAELKQNVDRTSPNILSMDVIKKAQEIEKLAKSVKDKMREAY